MSGRARTVLDCDGDHPGTDHHEGCWVLVLDDRPFCPWYLASHGCDLAPNHEGDHMCGLPEEFDSCGFTWPRNHEHTFTV